MDRQTCIETCTLCHRACLEAAVDRVGAAGRTIEPAHIRLLLDCAQICATSADFLLRGSDLHPEICGACLAVCERCARACDAHEDEQMRRCAEICRRCAASCRAMSRMVA